MDIDLTGRYIKCIEDTAKKHYPCNNGDYLLFKEQEGTYQYWGLTRDEQGVSLKLLNTIPRYHGPNVHLSSDFKLMPIGFIPPNEDKFLGALIANVGSGRRYIITEVLEDKYTLIPKKGGTGAKQQIHRPLKDSQWEVLSIKSNSVERLKDYQDNATIQPMEQDTEPKDIGSQVNEQIQEEDYTGRYIRALVNNPECSELIQNEIVQLIKQTNTENNQYKIETNKKGYSNMLITLCHKHIGTLYELLPKDYNPNKPIIFKIGDKVKIINRKPGNNTGTESLNGNCIGIIGYIEKIISNKDYFVTNKDMLLKKGTYKYYGIFDADDLELLPPDSNVEPSLLDQVMENVGIVSSIGFTERLGEFDKTTNKEERDFALEAAKSIFYPSTVKPITVYIGEKTKEAFDEALKIEAIESVKVQLTKKSNKRKF